MPISGLMVTLPADGAGRERVLAHVEADPCLTRGVLSGLRVALVSETGSPAEDEAVVEGLQRFDGVFVDVIFYDFSDVESVDSLPRRRRRRPEQHHAGEGG